MQVMAGTETGFLYEKMPSQHSGYVQKPGFSQGATVADLLQANVVLPSLMEYVDGTLVEKTGETLHHGLVQGNLSIEWLNFLKVNQQKGKALISPPARQLSKFVALMLLT